MLIPSTRLGPGLRHVLVRQLRATSTVAADATSDAQSPPPPPPPPADEPSVSSVPVAARPIFERPPQQEPHTNLPAPPSEQRHGHALAAFPSPPFHTHEFFIALQRSFPEPVARCLMKATRALLVHKMGVIEQERLGKKDIENHAYLFRAALSELRTELSMRTRNEFSAIRATNVALRREVEALDGRMKEELASLKDGLQMDIDNRKHEARSDIKASEGAVEDLGNKTQIALSEIRTEIEQAKWHNTRRGVALIGGVVLMIVSVTEWNMRENQRRHAARRANQNQEEQSI